jgi:GTP-binding protein
MARHIVEWDRAVHTREQFPKRSWPQVAFAGRSNVGKSSLLNRLFLHKLAGVSQTPGKTRSVNFYRVDEAYYLVDLPGYGYAKVSKTERQKFAALIGFFLEKNPLLAGVVQLIDMRHPATELDLKVTDYLQGLGAEHLIVLTKADKLSRGAGLKQKNETARQLGCRPDDLVTFSAVDGRGVKEIWTWVIARARGD